MNIMINIDKMKISISIDKHNDYIIFRNVIIIFHNEVYSQYAKHDLISRVNKSINLQLLSNGRYTISPYIQTILIITLN